MDSHHTSPRYWLWKHFAVGDWRSGFRFLNVDPDFQRTFEGHTREYVLRWFPDLRPEGCPGFAQCRASERLERIGGSPWFVVYDQSGRVQRFWLWKGE